MYLSGSTPTVAARSKGIAIILFITILLLAATTLLISEISINQRKAANKTLSALSLDQAKDALLGYAASQAIPGTLPCPDTSGDGFENPAVGGCQSALGLLPYKTLDIAPLTDTSGASLWYAVETLFVANAIGSRNSSSPGTLTLDADPQAAVIIAPQGPINDQERRTLFITDFLEGINADANLADYARVIDETHNDQLVGISTASFWSLIEQQVLRTATNLLNAYKDACLVYPFAANFGGPYISTNLLQFGSLPLTSALPFDWGAPCPLGNAPVPPGWLVTHWSDQLLYRFCMPVEGNCVTIINSDGSPAAGVVTAPGIALSGQTRPDSDPGDYFELENNANPDTEFRTQRPITHTGSYNDISRPL